MLKDSHSFSSNALYRPQHSTVEKIALQLLILGKLDKYLVEDWKVPKHREKLEDKVLYVICEENRFRITRLQCEKVSDLTSTQEEADIQTLLHALHALHAATCWLQCCSYHY